MIQADTISTGSAPTVAVVGAYWISSISALRNTTFPGVAARSLSDRETVCDRAAVRSRLVAQQVTSVPARG